MQNFKDRKNINNSGYPVIDYVHLDEIAKDLITAIKEMKMVSFMYDGHHRVLEPHTFGIFSNGKLILIGWQTDGTSERGGIPAWRQFSPYKIGSFKTLPKSFSKAREGYNPEDDRFKEILAKV